MEQGHSDIVLCVNRPSESEFRHEFRDLSNVRFSVSEEPKGTISELLNAKGMIGSAAFGLQYGDDLTEVDYNALIKFHESNNAFVTLAATTMYRLPVGVIEADGDGRVTAFVEKPFLGKPSWNASAVFDAEAVSYFRAGEDMSLNVLPRMLADGRRIFAFRVDSPWFDVGDFSAWSRADRHYRELERVR